MWPLAGAVGLTLLAVTRVEVSPDVGTWAAGPLPGEIVLALDDVRGGVLVGTREGVYRLEATGALRDLGLTGPVRALATDAGTTWVGTGDGVLRLDGDSGAARGGQGLAGVAVHALDADAAGVVAGAESGVHRREPGGAWRRLWPEQDAAATRVEAVLATARGVLFDHPQGLGLVRGDGTVEVLVEDVDVVALGPWPGTDLIWAGTRGGPLLLVSDDDGLTWTERADGLGYHAVHAVAPAPQDPQYAVAGGTGLADGTGNAGTQYTDDLGSTWHAEQDRLSNTHVFALEVRREPLRLRVRAAGTDLHASLALPVAGPRWYAGTNGSGVATHRPDVPALAALARLTPFLRVAEPIIAGTLLLASVLPAYRHLARGSPRSSPRGPPRRRARHRPEPAPHAHPRRNTA